MRNGFSFYVTRILEYTHVLNVESKARADERERRQDGEYERS